MRDAGKACADEKDAGCRGRAPAAVDKNSHRLYHLSPGPGPGIELWIRGTIGFPTTDERETPMGNEGDANETNQGQMAGPVLFYNEAVIDHFTSPRNVGGCG